MKKHCFNTRLTPWALLVLTSLVQAQIRTDASLGQSAQNLIGPNYEISQALGKLSGNNLFHSFQTFNLATGEVANFSTTNPGIANVISRVTGGSASQINGTVRLTAASGAPAFFFINPAGITFGAGASVDVPGAFHVGTANSVNFADGRFEADLGKTSTLSVAPPEAFGFLGSSRATLAVQSGAVLKPKVGSPISVVAGDVLIDGGEVEAKGGDVRAVAVGSLVTDVALSGTAPLVDGTLTVSGNGAISATSSSDIAPGSMTVRAGQVVLSGSGKIQSLNGSNRDAGTLQIQADQVTLDNQSYIYSLALEIGTGRSANIALQATGSVAVKGDTGGGASISTDTFSAANAGNVAVLARAITVSDAGYIASGTNVASTGSTGSIALTAADTIALSRKGKVYVTTSDLGRAGDVILKAGDISLVSDAYVSSIALEGSANAGDIEVNATRTLTLSDGATLTSTSNGSGNAGAVRALARDMLITNNSSIASTAILGAGSAGTVNVQASASLALRNGSRIDSSTYSAGQAGGITVSAPDIALDGGSTISSIASAGSGSAGKIDITSTGQLTLSNNSSIISNTFTRGDAGAIEINANNLRLETGARVSTASLSDPDIAPAPGNPGGAGGDITIRASGAFEINSGTLTATSSTSGRSGNIDVSARTMSLSGVDSRIDASAGSESSGQVGNIRLSAQDRIAMSSGASVTLVNLGSPTAAGVPQTGSFQVSAPAILLSDASLSASSFGSVAAGTIDVSFTGVLSLVSSRINTNTLQSDGGSITVQGGRLVSLNKSQITTSVSGLTGNGGNIRIGADALALNTGFIQANTFASNATGGRVNLNVRTLAASANAAQVGGQFAYFFKPTVFGFNVIQAAAPFGLSGNVQVSSPVLDLSGSLGRLGAPEMDVAQLGRTPCQTTTGSSLAQVGQGGLPVSYRGLLGPGSPIPAEQPGASWRAPIHVAMLETACQ